MENTWNRCQILSVSNDVAELYFIDYGHSQTCDVKDIMAIEDEFLAHPAMAYHCSLAGVDVADTWTDDNILNFVEQARSCEATFFTHGVRLDRTENGTRTVLNELFGFPKTTDVAVPVEDYSSMAVPLGVVQVATAMFHNVDKFFLSPADLSAYKVFF